MDNQWYAVCLSEEVRRGKKHGIRMYGRDIVLWRRRNGELAAIDARCPHMGASLAVGRVVDDLVECPYHGLLYDETGRCVRTPLRQDDALIPKKLCNRRYSIIERDGWVFLFWGDADADKPELQFFEGTDAGLMHAWSTRDWPVSFTRFVENTVDVAHLGTVHRNTLSWSIPDVIELDCKVNGNLIDVFPPSTTELGVLSSIIYPNMALLRLHPKFLTVFVAVPTEKERVRAYVRSSLGFVNVPVIGHIATYIKHWMDMGALWQDKQALFSVEPKDADEAKGEVLLEFDQHIAEYRKMRKKKRVVSDTL